ncbi:MAG: hypothetical protein KatS3mg110_3645 [Pirellulaceae bacterium]|nr:MAG: hypothetical protein KatS3mg110_3645 [Pirellulaceae bacterium]
MCRLRSSCGPLAFVFSVLTLTVPVLAGEGELAGLLPESTVLYVELQPAVVLERLLAHPVVKRIEALPQYKVALANPQLTQLRAAVTLVELRMQSTWPELVASMTSGGLVLAVDGKTDGWILLGKAANSEVAPRLRDTLLSFARQQAREHRQPDPVRSGEYRGILAQQVHNVRIAVFDQWYLATNKSDLGKAVLDIYLDKSAATLASKDSFQQAIQKRSPHTDVWAYADLDYLRRAGVAADLFSGKADNPAAELLLGGVLEVLRKAPYAAAEWSLSEQRACLRLYAPIESGWIRQPREYFFGAGLSGQAADLPRPEGTLLSISTYRNLSEFWLRAGELFDKETNDQLAQADSMLTTLFSGHDFGRDILGAIEPQWQLVVARQQFAADQPVPAIRLPAFALAGQLREPEKMRRELRRIFQSLVGFLNIVSAMQGQPQLELDEQRDGDLHLVLARFIPEADRPADAQVPIQYNFAPTLGFRGSRVVLASSPVLARRMLEDCPSEPVPPGTNTGLLIDREPLRQLLADNRTQLVSQAVLERGRSREEAEEEIDLVLKLLEAVDRFQMRLVTGEMIALEFELGFAGQQD